MVKPFSHAMVFLISLLLLSRTTDILLILLFAANISIGELRYVIYLGLLLLQLRKPLLQGFFVSLCGVVNM